MKYIFWFIVLYCVCKVNGQDISLKGHIVDTNGIALSDIHVLNTSKKKGTITNVDGHFEIVVKVGDTLEISSVQYVRVLRIIKYTDLEHSLKIVMHKNTSLLSDVVLIPKSLFLDTASREKVEINLNLPFENKIVKRPYIERQYDALKPKVAFYGIGVSASVLGSFTKEYKEIQNLRIIKEEERNTNNLYNCFEEAFYYKTLDIPKDMSVVFIDYCLQKDPSLNQFVKSKDIYTLIERLKYHSVAFKDQFKSNKP